MASFKDNFSKQAGTYAKYRPDYPDELFGYLQTLTKEHDLAWDCGTGNGQSAIGLSKYYRSVYATDPSEQQIRNALPHERITYKVEKAENPALSDGVVDLITVAQTLHWFEFDRFYSEVKRVLKPGAILAAWAYGLPSVNADIDEVIRHFHNHVVGEFWQPENRLIENGYATIPFPFEALHTPGFSIRKMLSLDDITGLVNSWSAVQRCIDKTGTNPVESLEPTLVELWGDPETERQATWKLILKVGKNAG